VWLSWIDGTGSPILLLDVPRVLAPEDSIGAQITATRVSVMVDGAVLGTVTYPSAPGPREMVGLVAPGTGSLPAARFDDLIAV
jgi:hypothetical protein